MASIAPQKPWEIGRAGPASPPGDELACAPWPQMADQREAWDDLARCAAEPNPFFESWYLLPSFEWLDRESNRSMLCYSHQGALCGLMPIVRQPHYQRWPIANIATWLHANTFLGTPLVRREAEVHFWRAVLDWADANPGISLFLHLNKISLDGPVFAALESVLAADGRPWAVVERRERALLSSDLDAEAYLARSLPARKRKDLDRRLRRLGELGEIEFRWETGSDRIVPWIEEFLALEASGWKGHAGSALACDASTDAVFRESLIGAARRERLVRLSLRLNGDPIAMLSTFVTQTGSFGFKTAFDEAYARFSPGFLLEREFVTALDRFDIRWCDSCAAADHSVMNRIWSERRSVGRVSIAIGGPLRRATFSQLLRKEVAGLNLEAFT
jgi:CelD/BcsL family acetyltransferase involved in cellulose biosynthesis